jgi:hypothetical protein
MIEARDTTAITQLILLEEVRLPISLLGSFVSTISNTRLHFMDLTLVAVIIRKRSWKLTE